MKAQHESRPGFFVLEKPDDLIESMKGLSQLFTQAVHVEKNITTFNEPKRSKRRKLPKQNDPKQSDYIRVTTEFMADKRRLLNALKDPLVQEAVKATGLKKDELLPKPREEFEREPNRAWIVPVHVADGRFKNFETRRYENIMRVVKMTEEMKPQYEKTQLEELDKKKQMQQQFIQAMTLEEQRMEKIQAARRKYERVLEREEQILKQRREEFEKLKQVEREREIKIQQAKQRQHDTMYQKSKQRQEKIDRVKKQKELLEKTRVQVAVAKRRYDESRMQARLSAKPHVERKGEKKRQEVAAGFKKAEANRFRSSQEMMERKSQMLADRAEKLRQRTAAWQEKQRLEQANRLASVARIRSAKAYRNERLFRKIDEQNTRMEYMKDLQVAVFDERGKSKKAQIIHKDAWSAEHSNGRIAPGPGEYDNATTMNTPGGVWGKYRPKSDIEWQIRAAAEKPGPGEYELKSLMAADIKGGTFGRTIHKTITTLVIEKAADLPGPGQYKPRPVPSTSGVTFSNYDDLSEFQRNLKRAAEVPGPADYGKSPIPRDRPKLKEMKRKLDKLAQSKVKKTQWSLNGDTKPEIETPVSSSSASSLPNLKAPVATAPSPLSTPVLSTPSPLSAATESSPVGDYSEYGESFDGSLTPGDSNPAVDQDYEDEFDD